MGCEDRIALLTGPKHMGCLGFPGFGLSLPGLYATLPSAPLTPATLGHQTRSPSGTQSASRQGSSCPAPGVYRRIPGPQWQGAALRTAKCSERIPGESCSRPPVAHLSTLPRKPPAGIKTHLFPFTRHSLCGHVDPGSKHSFLYLRRSKLVEEVSPTPMFHISIYGSEQQRITKN